MPSSFPGVASTELQALNESPNPTPHHTRASSLERVTATVRPHTQDEAREVMANLHRLSEEEVHQVEGNSSHSEAEDGSVLVSVVDGSYTVSTSTKVNHLVQYFIANLALTLFNKALMNVFPFPYLLTAVHCLFGTVGTWILHKRGYFVLTPLSVRDVLYLYAFSVLYTSNIVVSNVSMKMVNLHFHQVVRATTPAFTVGIYLLAFSFTYNNATFLSLIPVIVGVILTTYGDYSWTKPGLLLTWFGAFLAALKTVVTNRMQTSGLHLSALGLLYRMSPLAFLQSMVLSLYYQNELEGLLPLLVDAPTTFKMLMLFTVNGALAFALNYTSFTANKKAGALTMTVAANVKQILTVLLAITFWGLQVGYLNVAGIIMTLAGGIWYSVVEIHGKRRTSGVVVRGSERGEGNKL
ncbi:hypothetical protein N7G274_005924 [Stereocaulon virgatum]|uniref:Sugar phosphate transporter domain-containing protein n=1 Tax=Stereocaulon virgatum TaxID=373712 RepID=A0ABR4A6L1_9LECA